MWALHPLTIQVINNFHPLTSPFKVVSVTAVATMLPGHHAYERATETFETTTTATVHWKTEGWWSNGDGWKELKGNWVMEIANMLKILRVSSCIDDVLISTAWISIWCDLIALSSLIAWLACCKKLTCLPAPQECIRTIWYNQNLASVVPFLHPWKWCFLFPPTAPKLQAQPCSAMECSHAVFGPSQDEWFKGSQANVLVEASARSEHQNLRTAETWIDVEWCRGRRPNGAVDPKAGGNWNGNSVTAYVLYIQYLGYDSLCPGSCLLVVKFTTLSWSSKSIFHSEAWIPSKQHGVVQICSLKTRNHPSHMNCSRTSHFS